MALLFPSTTIAFTRALSRPPLGLHWCCQSTRRLNRIVGRVRPAELAGDGLERHASCPPWRKMLFALKQLLVYLLVFQAFAVGPTDRTQSNRVTRFCTWTCVVVYLHRQHSARAFRTYFTRCPQNVVGNARNEGVPQDVCQMFETGMGDNSWSNKNQRSFTRRDSLPTDGTASTHPCGACHGTLVPRPKEICVSVVV